MMKYSPQRLRERRAGAEKTEFFFARRLCPLRLCGESQRRQCPNVFSWLLPLNRWHLLSAVATVCSLTTAVAVNAQKPVVIKGGKLCEGYLLKKADSEKAEDSRVVKLKAFNRNDKRLSPDVKKWLESSDVDTLSVRELRYGKKRALLLNSISSAATGLAINFQYWLIKFDDKDVEFMSRSENPNLIFWGKDGLINYYSIRFSDTFIPEKDWGKVTYDILRYRITRAGKSKLVSEERNVKCE